MCTSTRFPAIDSACVRQSVVFDVITQMIAEPTFTTLRTKEQLGYVAAAIPFAVPAFPTFPSVDGMNIGDDVAAFIIIVQGANILVAHPSMTIKDVPVLVHA